MHTYRRVIVKVTLGCTVHSNHGLQEVIRGLLRKNKFSILFAADTGV